MNINKIVTGCIICLIALVGIVSADVSDDKLTNMSLSYECDEVGLISNLECKLGTPISNILKTGDTTWSYEYDDKKRPITIGMIIAILGIIWMVEDRKSKKNKKKPMKRTRYTY